MPVLSPEAIRADLVARVQALRPGNAEILAELEKRLDDGGLEAVLDLVGYFRLDGRRLPADLPPEARPVAARHRYTMAVAAVVGGFVAKHAPEATDGPSSVRALTTRRQRDEATRDKAVDLAERLTGDGLSVDAHWANEVARRYEELLETTRRSLEAAREVRRLKPKIRYLDELVGMGPKRGPKRHATTSAALLLNDLLGGDVLPSLPSLRTVADEERLRLVHAVVVTLLEPSKEPITAAKLSDRLRKAAEKKPRNI